MARTQNYPRKQSHIVQPQNASCSSASGSRREAAACVALRRFAARRALYRCDLRAALTSVRKSAIRKSARRRLQSNLRDSKEMQLAETLGQMQAKASSHGLEIAVRLPHVSHLAGLHATEGDSEVVTLVLRRSWTS